MYIAYLQLIEGRDFEQELSRCFPGVQFDRTFSDAIGQYSERNKCLSSLAKNDELFIISLGELSSKNSEAIAILSGLFRKRRLIRISDIGNDAYGNIFLLSARYGNVAAAKMIIHSQENQARGDGVKPMIRAVDPRRRGAVALAALADSVEFLRYLYFLKKQYGVTKINLFRDQGGYENAAELVIENDRRNAAKWIFLIASEEGHIELVKALYKHFLDGQPLAVCLSWLLIKNENNQNAFLLALFNEREEVVEFLKPLIDKCFIGVNKENIQELNANALLKEMIKEMIDEYFRFYLEKSVSVSNKTARNSAQHPLVLPGKISQEGKCSIFYQGTLPRGPRSFFGERERQLLRQVATQLFLGLKVYPRRRVDIQLTEIQLMHLRYQGKSNLFIAANHDLIGRQLQNFIEEKTLKSILQEAYAGDAEGKVRSQRYAKKLKERVYGQQGGAFYTAMATEDGQHAQIVSQILEKGHVMSIPIALQSVLVGKSIERLQLTPESKLCIRYALMQEQNIYILQVKESPYAERHAEEYLVDVRECVENEVGLYTAIAGKKRPCMGCSGRMKNKITHYGQHPGLFWVNTIEWQAPEVARTTLELLATVSTHKTVVDGKELTDYDSASQSGGEEDEKIFTIEERNSPERGVFISPAHLALEYEPILALEYESIKVKEIKIASDGNCLFRAILTAINPDDDLGCLDAGIRNLREMVSKVLLDCQDVYFKRVAMLVEEFIKQKEPLSGISLGFQELLQRIRGQARRYLQREEHLRAYLSLLEEQQRSENTDGSEVAEQIEESKKLRETNDSQWEGEFGHFMQNTGYVAYCNNIHEDKTWGGELELKILSAILDLRIEIYGAVSVDQQHLKRIFNKQAKSRDVIFLYHVNGDHYNLLKPTEEFSQKLEQQNYYNPYFSIFYRGVKKNSLSSFVERKLEALSI